MIDVPFSALEVSVVQYLRDVGATLDFLTEAGTGTLPEPWLLASPTPRSGRPSSPGPSTW
ncbi:MAG TPA: hypothetical protein VFH94_12210 [Streptomyces sp.]|nr:hypothetical protein [Streptomyces sp.]